MNQPNHMTPEQFRSLGHRMVDWIADYMARVERLPVRSTVEPGWVLGRLDQSPPSRPEDDWDGIFADLESTILPALTHWQSPTFFGYFPCNATGPSILAELLSAGLGVQGMLWQTSPACTELEIRMLDWMADLLDLPDTFRSTSVTGGGVIQGTASEATLVAMVAARDRIKHDGPLVAYCSSQAHSSVRKAAMICGVSHGAGDEVHLRAIATDDALAMDPEALRAAIEEDRRAGRTPFYVCATVGTTSTTAVDPLPGIGAVLARTGFTSSGGWLHVDAAHAGAACICPEFRWMLDGIEHVDSLCFNPHKWLLTNFDCDCFWTSDRRAIVNALSITPEYLRNEASESGRVQDLRDWQIPLGRRFRSLKLWFVMRHYGAAGLQAHVREGVRLATLFEQLVRQDDRFEIAAPRTLNLVCFRLTGADARTRALMEAVNASGEAFLTHTVVPVDGHDRFVMRMAIGAVATREHHVRAAWSLIQRLAAELPE